ncbi:hypothetical protein ACFOSW_31060 [Paenibacillus sp. GCM10012303]|jgi:hypothetical protein
MIKVHQGESQYSSIMKVDGEEVAQPVFIILSVIWNQGESNGIALTKSNQAIGPCKQAA